ncbi:MAG: type II secretion system protein [Synergistales bacterium]|nr:type II secretion system protein [Synergistales bacterium]MDY6401309.1 type II secretion system protein [Synergistales bacterium]MDY6405298.1 type II secretion system protein [Synergistales bacterium]MDY6410988.1 type II secretion system protein [Synergistales bacterium]MDY6414700.1 type II secretion system protein [Synergistales bacterium]
MANRKKGFTLVELLIVIVVIGVLSAMMMLSSTEAVSSAKAANIINNLRNWKTAMLEWYADNIDKVDDKGKVRNKSDTGWTNLADGDSCVQAMDITKYLNGEFKASNFVDSSRGANHCVEDSSGLTYWIQHFEKDGAFIWCIGCRATLDDTSSGNKTLLQKLEARAKSTNLLNRDLTPYTSTGGNKHLVWMEVIDFRNN